jgi:hypothetical protein
MQQSFLFVVPFVALTLSACGDDESKPPVDVADASAPSQSASASVTVSATTSQSSSAAGDARAPAPDASSTAHVEDSGVDLADAADAAPPAVECLAIAAACDGVGDGTAALGALCRSVASGGNAAECSALLDDCSTYCAVPAVDAGADGAVSPEPTDAGQVSDAAPGAEAPIANAENCASMGHVCHEYDEGSGLGHLCHEVGHGGNLTWCAAIIDECVALCGNLEPEHGHEETLDAAADGGDAH